MRIESRQFSGLNTPVASQPRPRKYGRQGDRAQIALRPSTMMFRMVAAWASEWRVSWNEAALRLIEAGLNKQ